MTRDELKLRAACLAAAFLFGLIADIAPAGFVGLGASISAVLCFVAAWMPWKDEPPESR